MTAKFVHIGTLDEGRAVHIDYVAQIRFEPKRVVLTIRGRESELILAGDEAEAFKTWWRQVPGLVYLVPPYHKVTGLLGEEPRQYTWDPSQGRTVPVENTEESTNESTKGEDT